MKRNTFLRVIALLLIISLIPPFGVDATEAGVPEPCSSSYIHSYSTYISQTSAGTVKINFTIYATEKMDDIGAVSIMLFESSDNQNWKQVRVYDHEDYPSMLATGASYHSSYVSYPGTSGHYYKAYICLWAAKDGGGDSRYLWEYYP